MVADAGLDLALPPKVPTHLHKVSKKWTKLDHVFLSDHSFDALISCDTLPDNLGLNTGHLPIVTKVDLALAKAPSKSISNFRNVDWDKFKKALKEHLRDYGLPKTIKNRDSKGGTHNRAGPKVSTLVDQGVHAPAPRSE